MARRLVELLIRRAGAGRLHLQTHFANDLALLQGGRQHVDKEAVEIEVALTVRPNRARGTAERQDHGGQVARGIGVSQGTGKRALGPHLRIANFVDSLDEHGRHACHLL